MSSRRIIDLRSDTSSLPTREMLEAIPTAPLGNDGFGEDPTVNALQDLACRKLGKESSLFVPSGTQGNLIALLSNSAPGQYLIADKDSHILRGEMDAYAKVAGLGPLPLQSFDGAIDPALIRTAISETKEGQIAMVSVENMPMKILRKLDIAVALKVVKAHSRAAAPRTAVVASSPVAATASAMMPNNARPILKGFMG